YIVAVADPGNAQFEMSKANNLLATPIALALPPLPDLAAVQISGSASAIIGQSAQIIFTITNAGTGLATAPWVNQFFIASDTQGTGAQSLGTASFTNSVPVGGFIVVTQSVTLPGGVFGARFLGVMVDSANEVVESNETNNTTFSAAATVIAVPDLVVTQISAPASAIMGQTVPLVFTLTNLGAAPAFVPWQNRILLASDAGGNGAQSLGTATFTSDLAAGASLTVTQTVILPFGLIGARYFGVVADSANQVVESNENNNSAWAAAAITINGSDLAVTQLNAPASAQFGQSFTVQFAVTNFGGAPVNAAWLDRLFLSALPNSVASAPLLGSFAGSPPLAPGDGYTRSQVVTLPLTTSSADGSFFIVAVADAGSALFEANEANNLLSVPIFVTRPPLPDLAIPQVTAPDMARGGLPFTLSWSVTNQGTLNLANLAWNEAISISNANGTVSTLAEFRFTNTLAAGDFLVRTQSVVLPSSTVAGDLVCFVTVDSGGEVVEFSESNNLTFATNLTALPAQLSVSLARGDVKEGDPAFTGTVTRNGSISGDLLVAITNSRPDKLAVTNLLTIPAGALSANFTITPLFNGVVDADALVTLEAGAADYFGAAAAVTVRNIDHPHLALTLDSPLVPKGLTVGGTVSRDYGLGQDLEVVFGSSDPSRLLPPVSVTIASNQTSAAFTVLAVQNNQVDGIVSNFITANAIGFAPASAQIGVVDNNLPSVVLSLDSTNISEGDGPLATRATLTRAPVAALPLVLDLVASRPDKVSLPATVVIPANQAAVSFPVGAVDNQIVDGDSPVDLHVFIRATGSTRDLAEGVGASLIVRDDDGPTLRLTLARDVVPEGQSPATTGTVTRNTSTNAPLVVNLSSGNPGAATVPASVTIPAGAYSVTFPIASIDDGVPSGNRSVVFTAAAPGYTPGLNSLVVSDIQLPDLLVASITVPANALTEAFFTLGYRVENRGVARAGSNFVTRFYLSSDPVIGNDSLLGQYATPTSLPAGQYFEQSVQFRLPTAAGRYWIVVITDADNQINEIREDNNSAISAVPIQVDAAYTATVQASVTTALIPTNVVLTGHATKRGGGPALSVPVNIHLHLRGSHRVQQAITDLQGNFSTVFTPLPNEAGVYDVAAAHPGEMDASGQASFTLLGLGLSPANLPVLVTEGTTVTGAVSVVNLGDTPLSGLSASVVSAPANLVATVSLGQASVAGQSSVPLTFTVHPASLDPLQGIVTAQVTSGEGLMAQVSLYVAIAPLRSRLVATPANLYSAMAIGGQQRVQFALANAGGVTSGPVTIALPNLPWLSLAGTNPLPPLAPGQTNLVTLLLTPDTNVDLGPYAGSLVAYSSDSSVTVPFNFLAMSEALGALRVEAVDEFTYYAVGSPKVTNAAVVITDPVTQTVITNGMTDADGLFFMPALPEAYYQVDVTALQHVSYRGTLRLHGGVTNDLQAFISREMVRYNWTVVPTTVEDRTRITIETTFETFVPAPVVTIYPAMFDLADVQGDVGQVTLQITNHGLIAANEFTITVGTHPDWQIVPLITNFGKLPAQSSLTVPVSIYRLTGGGAKVAQGAGRSTPKAGSSGSPCGFSLGGFW
ncbi:MAG: hypothetical protein NTW03_16040, partial [Verrucomicrobia bacterium]|nr:hypothetical protein [Verrucomicrobiota bacterium]